MAYASVVLRLRLWKATREEMAAQTIMSTELQEQLAAKSAELSQLAAKYGEQTDKLSRLKSQHAAGATVVNDLKSIAEAYERPAKCAKITWQCKESSTIPLTAKFLALLSERDVPQKSL